VTPSERARRDIDMMLELRRWRRLGYPPPPGPGKAGREELLRRIARNLKAEAKP